MQILLPGAAAWNSFLSRLGLGSMEFVVQDFWFSVWEILTWQVLIPPEV